MLLPGQPWVPWKIVCPFGPAVWPAIANIYTNICERRALLFRILGSEACKCVVDAPGNDNVVVDRDVDGDHQHTVS